MLTRKPRINEILEYKCYEIIRYYKVTRFDGNIMYILNMESGEVEPCIWQRHNGEFNKYFSHKESNNDSV